MYVPPQFEETREEVLLAAIGEIRLACLVTSGERLTASHVPMVARRSGSALVLSTHVARGNTHWQAAGEGRQSLAVFQGPQAYISPSWYASKAEHGKVVPTWNYIAVHAEGTLRAVHDTGWLIDHLAALTDANEADRPQPWAITDAPGDFVPKLARAIVGLELTVERLEGAWKMIQHKPDADRTGAIAGLAARGGGDAAVARIMAELEAGRR